MIDSALSPDQRSRQQFASAWLAQTADQVIGQLESHRATWQSWHMYAEAQRQVRDIDVPPQTVADVVERLVATATARLIHLPQDLHPNTPPTPPPHSAQRSVYRHPAA